MHYVELSNNFTSKLRIPSCSLSALWLYYLRSIAPAVPSYCNNYHFPDCTEAGFFLPSVSLYHYILLMSFIVPGMTCRLLHLLVR